MTEEEMIKWAMNEDWDAMNYQKSMVQRDDAVAKSREALARKDYYMFKFWSKAAREFERRSTEQLTETLDRKKRVVAYEMWQHDLKRSLTKRRVG